MYFPLYPTCLFQIIIGYISISINDKNVSGSKMLGGSSHRKDASLDTWVLPNKYKII